MSKRSYQINEVSQLAGISVRALHHYDRIGLLVPTNRSAAGYRLYTDADLLRLQQVLIGRTLGLALEDIRRMLDDTALDRRALLHEQRKQLAERVRTTTAMMQAIDAAIAILDDSRSTPMDMKQIFDGFDPAEYEQEAKQRWGETDAYKESARRTKQYKPEDWRQMKEEYDSIMNDAAAALRSSLAADDSAVMDIAERHRLSIDRWFYPCSARMHAALADMYEADHRFAHSIDKYAPGLTPFFSAAIRANGRRH